MIFWILFVGAVVGLGGGLGLWGIADWMSRGEAWAGGLIMAGTALILARISDMEDHRG